MERELVTLNDGDVISFVDTTENLGTAEFAVCTKYVRGKLHKAFITPHQQENITKTYVIDVFGADSLSIDSWMHKGVSSPKIWIHGWCKEHNCPFMRVYVPPGTSKLVVGAYSTLTLRFEV